jgi:AraC-like DNA-binding protein
MRTNKVITGINGVESVSMTQSYFRALSQTVYEMQEEHRQVITENLLQLITIIQREDKSGDIENQHSVNESALLDVKRFVTDNLHRVELSPEYIARHFNFSLRYLYNLFKNETLSVAGYIKEARLIGAKNKILATIGTHKTISEIAYSVGFNNMSHFCKVFKLKFNETPMEMKSRCVCTASNATSVNQCRDVDN